LYNIINIIVLPYGYTYIIYIFNFVFEFVDKNIMLLMITAVYVIPIVFIKNNSHEHRYQWKYVCILYDNIQLHIDYRAICCKYSVRFLQQLKFIKINKKPLKGINLKTSWKLF